MSNFRLKKLKTSKEIEIHWNDDNLDSFQLISKDAALPALYDAMDALKPHVMQYLGLPQDWEDTLTITGITITPTDDGPAATITAQRRMFNGKVLVLNTPHDLVPLDLVANIEIEAMDYLDGNRKQGDLFEGENKKAESAMQGLKDTARRLGAKGMTLEISDGTLLKTVAAEVVL